MITTVLHSLGGFFIQILPCAFFCLYPFSDSFRFSRKLVVGGICAIMAVMAGVFTYIYAALDVPSGNYDSYLPLNLVFLLTLGILLAFYVFCIRAQTVHKLFVFILILNYGFLMTELVSYMLSFFPESQGYLYSSPVLFLHLLFNGILFYPMLTILKHARDTFRSQIAPSIWREIILLPAIFFAGQLIFYEIPTSAGIAAAPVLSLLVKAMDILMLFQCFIVLRTLEAVRKQANKQIALEAVVKNYKSLEETADRIRKARHEFNHHIAALSILLQNQDYEGASGYLNRIAKINIEAASDTYTPDALLNSMLSEYRKQALAADVRTLYSIHVPEPVYMEEPDMCQFLSNLLDNALEANAHLEADKRQLSLTIRQTGNFLYFRCENPCAPAQLRLADVRQGTSKPDKAAHGYGIPIMKNIAEKYNGIFRTEVKDGIFSASANLCMPAPASEA